MSQPRGSHFLFSTVHFLYHSIAEADFACWRRMNFWIFPVEVFGSVPKITVFGALKRAMCPRQNSMISISVGLAPAFNSTNAHGVSPHFGSGFATTAAAITA